MGTTIYIAVSVLLIFALSVMLVRRYVENMALYDALKIKLNENTELEKTCGKLEFDNAKLQLELKRYKDTLKDEGQYLVQTTCKQSMFQGAKDYDARMIRDMEFPDIVYAREVFMRTIKDLVMETDWFNTFVSYQMKSFVEDPMKKRMEIDFIMHEHHM